MKRARTLLAAVLALAPLAAMAQQAEAPSPQQQRRRAMLTTPREPIPLLPTAQASTTTRHPRVELAPMPNRDIELPAQGYSMQAKLMPDIFRRSMPGRGLTAEGVSNQREERVYTPGAGARLTVPFFTR